MSELVPDKLVDGGYVEFSQRTLLLAFHVIYYIVLLGRAP